MRFTTTLLATLAASIAPLPGLASTGLRGTEEGIGKTVDMKDLIVSISYDTDKEADGVRDGVLVQEAIVSACNEAYPEEDLHMYRAKVMEETHHPVMARSGQNGNNGGDIEGLDLEELAQEAVAIEELVMDDELTMEEFRNAVLELKKSKRNRGRVTPFNDMAYSFLITVEVHCGPTCSDEYLGAPRLTRTTSSKRKQLKADFEVKMAEFGFGTLKNLEIDIFYHGHEIDQEDEASDEAVVAASVSA